MNENYINYIHSNPKLLHKVDELSVADMETKGNYMTLDLPCENNQPAVILLPIRMQNGKIITSTQTSLLFKTDPPIEARKAHLFTGLNKALLSIGNVFDHGCQSVFNYKTVIILNKRNGKIMMKGK